MPRKTKIQVWKTKAGKYYITIGKKYQIWINDTVDISQQFYPNIINEFLTSTEAKLVSEN